MVKIGLASFRAIPRPSFDSKEGGEGLYGEMGRRKEGGSGEEMESGDRG